MFAARQLIDETSRKIAARVMARHLPSGFERRISEIVHGTSVVLEDLVTSYALTRAETGEAVVVIDQTYIARNYGQAAELYQPRNAEEGMYDPRYEILEVVHKALRAIARRRAGDRAAARACPPLEAPSFDRATAAGFLVSGTSAGASACSVASWTT